MRYFLVNIHLSCWYKLPGVCWAQVIKDGFGHRFNALDSLIN